MFYLVFRGFIPLFVCKYKHFSVIAKKLFPQLRFFINEKNDFNFFYKMGYAYRGRKETKEQLELAKNECH